MPTTTTITEQPALAAALAYAAMGWSVVPVAVAYTADDGVTRCTCGRAACESPGKHPIIPWREAQRIRADEAMIRHWFATRRTLNLGIVTGTASGLFVVDVDTGDGKEGADTINALQMAHDDLPETVTAITGGGGRHYLFRQPPGVKIKTGRNTIGRHVDTRGDGGFIVAPPSSHISGQSYRWTPGYGPGEVAIADAPEWLLRLAVEGAGGLADMPAGGTSEIVTDASGKVTDGREAYMLSMVSGSILNLVRKHGGHAPSVDEVFDDAWPVYESKVVARHPMGLEAESRGPTAMRQKIVNQLVYAVRGQWPEFSAIQRQELALVRSPDGDGPTFPYIRSVEIQPSLETHDFVEGLLADQQTSILYGDSNLGKTFLAVDLGYTVAQAAIDPTVKWRDREVIGGSVLYCALEGTRGIVNRAFAYKLFNAVPDDADIPFAIMTSQIDLMDAEADIPTLIRTLNRLAVEQMTPTRLTIIDTLAQGSSGDENSGEDMARLMRHVAIIRRETGSHVMLVHHSGKDTTRGMRGHSSLRGSIDTEIELTKGKAGGAVANVRKQREMECSGTFPFRLQTVELGRDTVRGKAVKSCVVIHETDPAATVQPPAEVAPPTPAQETFELQRNAAIVLHSLSMALTLHGEEAPESVTTAHAVQQERFFEIAIGQLMSRTGASEDAANKALYRAVIGRTARGKILPAQLAPFAAESRGWWWMTHDGAEVLPHATAKALGTEHDAIG